MTQAHNTAQEHTGKLIENAISKALSKTQDTTASPPNTLHASTRNATYASTAYDSHQTSSWPPAQPAISQTPWINTHPTYKHQESQTNTQTDNIEQQVHQTPLTLTSQWLLF